MGDVVRMNMVTRLDISPDAVIEAASEANLACVVIIGFDADGNEYFASSKADGADVLWHIERAKHKLMVIADG